MAIGHGPGFCFSGHAESGGAHDRRGGSYRDFIRLRTTRAMLDSY
jgi:hypothetical protein